MYSSPVKTEIPWRHYFFCMLIYGVLVAVIDPDAVMRGVLLVGTIAGYIIVAKMLKRA